MRPLKDNSQCARILGHLTLGRKITALTALDKFGTLRLGARVLELRKRGHRIKSSMATLPNKKRIAVYSL